MVNNQQTFDQLDNTKRIRVTDHSFMPNVSINANSKPIHFHVGST